MKKLTSTGSLVGFCRRNVRTIKSGERRISEQNDKSIGLGVGISQINHQSPATPFWWQNLEAPSGISSLHCWIIDGHCGCLGSFGNFAWSRLNAAHIHNLNAILTFRLFGFSGDVKWTFEQNIFRIKQSVSANYQNRLNNLWSQFLTFFDISLCHSLITLPAALHWCRLQVFWTPATCSTAWQPREPREQAMPKQSAP